MRDPSPSGSKASTLAYRDSILVELHAAGLPSARRPPVADRQRALMLDSGVIEGLPVLLRCHRQSTVDIAKSQNAAEEFARDHGCELWATVHHRRGRDLGHSLVTLPLSHFAALLRQVQESDPTPTALAVR